jgi:glucokinase
MPIVAGDIGGTKTHLALIDQKNPRLILKQKKYPSKDFENLEEILLDFLQGESLVQTACFGIAGPIENGKCHATNLPWIIDSKAISKRLNISQVHLINDLEANAWGISWLKDDELVTLNEGIKEITGNQALIAAGTGLGEAGFFWNGREHFPFACEGGHCDFGPMDQEQLELWRFLKAQYDHVSYERILSGPGLVSLYQFFVQTGKEKECEMTKKAMQIDNPSKVITEKALKKECKACMRALDMFVFIYGGEAGNLALKFLAFGGLFIGGGIAPKIVDVMKNGLFLKGFLSKGRFSKLLSQIPIKLILNENTALLGASRYATEK